MPMDNATTYQGSFRGGTRGNVVPIVLNNTLWTASQTIFRPKCTRLQDFAYIQSRNFSKGRPTSKRPWTWCLDPDTNFRLARQRSYCSCFTTRPLLHIQRYSYEAVSLQLFFTAFRCHCTAPFYMPVEAAFLRRPGVAEG